jgi:hypothetical protein
LSGFHVGHSCLDHGFEVLCAGSPVGRRRHLDDAAVSELKGFYAGRLGSSQPAAGLLKLGRELKASP